MRRKAEVLRIWMKKDRQMNLSEKRRAQRGVFLTTQ
jgi:hypothetical protein